MVPLTSISGRWLRRMAAFQETVRAATLKQAAQMAVSLVWSMNDKLAAEL